jgi:hypothetical protein
MNDTKAIGEESIMPATTMAPSQPHFLSLSDEKLIIIRKYLQKNISCGTIEEVSQPDGELTLTVTSGGGNRYTVQISSALLSDQHLTPIELRWALKEKDIARKMLDSDYTHLDHATLRARQMGAIERWPRQ